MSVCDIAAVKSFSMNKPKRGRGWPVLKNCCIFKLLTILNFGYYKNNVKDKRVQSLFYEIYKASHS